MMQWQFPPIRRTGSPIMQVVTGMIGLVVIVALGLFALGAAAVIVVGLVVALAIRRLLSGPSKKPPAQPFHSSAQNDLATPGNVIDGEYVVINSNHADPHKADPDPIHAGDRRPSIR